jgi:fructose-specific phosphotransferase system component IIB
MIENKQLRFDRSKVNLPHGLPEIAEEATHGRALRWYVGQITPEEVVVEATVDSEKIGEFSGNVEDRFHAGRSVAISIIPTGVGCSIGGYAGDAAPVTRLLSSTVDYLVTNPNAVNASDFAQINDNVLYTEGYCIDLLCRGKIDLYVPHSNSIGVIVEKSSDARLDLAFNVINAVRAVHGVDIQHVVVTDRPIGSRCVKNETGAFVGTVDHPEVLSQACESLLARGVHAIGVTTNVQDLPFDDYAAHFAGQAPNPVGGVEAIISHFIVNRYRVPAAHAPLQNIKDLALESPVVDARGAGEFTSLSGLACVLMGLARAPHIAPRPGTRVRDVVNLNNVVAVVAPASCLGGIPTLFAARYGIPTIAVRDNETILSVTREALGLENVIEVGSYAEAAGVLLALEQGIALQSIARPLPTLRHPAARPHGKADVPAVEMALAGAR